MKNRLCLQKCSYSHQLMYSLMQCLLSFTTYTYVHTDIFSPGLDPLTVNESHGHHGHHVNVELNVWTRPDCEGTPFENGNRTWFYFGVRGGQPSHILRLNVMNLNRQAKLYSQGMHPVVKIGACGKWERAKDRPSYRVSSRVVVCWH